MTEIVFDGVLFARKRIKKIIQRAASEVFDMHHAEMFTVTILAANNRRMKEINRRQRGIDSVTDVLSFPSSESFKGDEDGFYGDIVVSIPKAKNQAKQFDQSFERELTFLVIHGCLHLLGYDHDNEVKENKMRDAQRDALRRIEEIQK